MLTGQRPATSRRSRKNRRTARIAVALAIPVALGGTLGVVFAVSSHGTTNVSQSAFGRHQNGGSPTATPTPTGSATASSTASPSAMPTTSASAGTTVAPANSFANGAAATFQLGPRDGPR